MGSMTRKILNIQTSLLCLFVVSQLFLFGCSSQKVETVDSKLSRVQEDIEVENYDKALIDIDQIIGENPNSDRARAIKASIYVHRAGIRLKDYFEFEKAMSDEKTEGIPLFDDESLAKIKIQAETLHPQAMQFLQGLNLFYQDVQDFTKRVERLPVFLPEKANDFLKALDILSTLRNPSTGQHLYRAVIKTIYFKHLWTQGEFSTFSSKELCQIPVQSLENRIQDFYAWMRTILVDGAKGIPSKKTSIEKVLAESEKVMIEVNKVFGQVQNKQVHLQTALMVGGLCK